MPETLYVIDMIMLLYILFHNKYYTVNTQTTSKLFYTGYNKGYNKIYTAYRVYDVAFDIHYEG